MTIQRQYSLPNCRLVLEGLGDDVQSSSSSFIDERPIMTILVNAECHFSGHEKPISGGREFLDHLAISVNQYAQQMLSGVPHRFGQSNGKISLISFHQTDASHHRLTVQDAGKNAPDPNSKHEVATHLDLSTVQLFDLVEAIDQMVADAQTLPDIFLDLTPVPKRSTVSAEPVASRVVPATLGISGLAVAAIALFFVPTPEFEPTAPESQATEDVLDNPTTSSPPGIEPDAETSADSSSSVNLSSDEDIAEGDRVSATSINDIPSQDDIEELLTSSTPIVDSDQLDTLTNQLQARIIEAWDQSTTFDEDLEYRVGVSEAGDIVGFKFVNDASLTYVDEVPLLDLTLLPIDPTVGVDAPMGQFKVVFLPDGVVQVSPWYGRPPEDNDS